MKVFFKPKGKDDNSSRKFLTYRLPLHRRWKITQKISPVDHPPQQTHGRRTDGSVGPNAAGMGGKDLGSDTSLVVPGRQDQSRQKS